MLEPTSQPIPDNPFALYKASPDSPWDVAKVGHLLRRITFGATAQQLDAMLKLSPKQAIDSLLDYDPQFDPFADVVEKMEGMVNLDSPDLVQKWWIYRMLHSPQPAQEKLALFWHNRFATSAAKVGNGLFMAGHVDLLRREGLGSFRDFVVDIAHDPAMLIWLDGQSNRKGRPNENFAREVMELFTLGVGNYTEKDVKELARAFTGWQIRGVKGEFIPSQFDPGDKEIFGTRDNYSSGAAIDLILTQPAAPKFLSGKMLREFVHPHPTDEMVDHYAQVLLDEKWQIKPVLKQMLSSRMFFSDWAYMSKIKSPAEIAIGGANAVGGKVNVEFVRQSMSRMGQNVLYPPNVKGWDGEEAWINANTVLVRFNYGMMMATQREFAKKTDLEAMLHAAGATTSADIIDYFARVLLDGKLDPEARAKFIDYMGRDDKGNVKIFQLNPTTVNSKVRGMMHLMMSTPQFQLA